MRGDQIGSGNRAELSLRKRMGSLQHVLLGVVVALAPVALIGCAGLVSGANTTSSPPSTLNITNVQVACATTSTCQINWITHLAANSEVDYGTSSSYGSSTPVDPAMVTSHQVAISGLAAATTYYYQVSSTDSKNNNGKSVGQTFKTTGFSMSGTISPATNGSGTTVTLSGGASATATADSSGNYIVTGLGNGKYTVTPSRTGYTFIPAGQSANINGANITGLNFVANVSAAAAPPARQRPVNQTATAGQDTNVHAGG